MHLASKTFFKKKKQKDDYFFIFIFKNNITSSSVIDRFGVFVCCYWVNAFKRIKVDYKSIIKYKKIYIFSKM